MGVQHIKGHIAANYIEYPELEPPFLCLVVSGGHTHLVKVCSHVDLEVIGLTHDDAAGEAFDKVARAIGLGYPGGPAIDAAARRGDPEAVEFPRARIAGSKYDFSFSGVKSSVLNYLNSCRMAGIQADQADVAASFQRAVVDVLVEHAINAAKELGESRIAMAGGVAANSELRSAMRAACEAEGIALFYPPPVYCTDNAAMIAAQGYYEYQAGTRHGWDLNAVPGLGW